MIWLRWNVATVKISLHSVVPVVSTNANSVTWKLLRLRPDFAWRSNYSLLASQLFNFPFANNWTSDPLDARILHSELRVFRCCYDARDERGFWWNWRGPARGKWNVFLQNIGNWRDTCNEIASSRLMSTVASSKRWKLFDRSFHSHAGQLQS